MNSEDFNLLAGLLRKKSGLALTEDKLYLLQSRLMPIAIKYGCAGLPDLAARLRTKNEAALADEITEAMTTNETLFFRDDRPFRHFRAALLPDMLKSRAASGTLRIWSAACSTGQEPYSIAITLHELLQSQPGWKVEIVATDIAETVLAKARSGIYTQFEIQRGLPVQMMISHFTKLESGDWKIHDKFRDMVRFENFNLLGPMERLGTFDIIFCRNVLIYFDEPTKKAVLQSLSRRLAPDGYLFLGGAESALCSPEHLALADGCAGLYRPAASRLQATG